MENEPKFMYIFRLLLNKKFEVNEFLFMPAADLKQRPLKVCLADTLTVTFVLNWLTLPISLLKNWFAISM